MYGYYSSCRKVNNSSNYYCTDEKYTEYTDDLKKRIEADIQKVTDESIKAIDDAFAAKEKEIMTV